MGAMAQTLVVLALAADHCELHGHCPNRPFAVARLTAFSPYFEDMP
jgi:hypothetical protein